MLFRSCSSAGTSRDSSCYGPTSLSTLLVLICRAWTWKWWTRRWWLTRLPSRLLLKNLLLTSSKSKTLPLLLMATTPLPTLEPSDTPDDTPEEICLDLFFFFFFRSNFGTIQSNLKTMHVAPCFNGLFDVNIMVKLFSLIVLPNAK